MLRGGFSIMLPAHWSSGCRQSTSVTRSSGCSVKLGKSGRNNGFVSGLPSLNATGDRGNVQVSHLSQTFGAEGCATAVLAIDDDIEIASVERLVVAELEFQQAAWNVDGT